MEGEILWKKDHYAIRYFEDGDEHLQSLALGDEIEVLVNDAWKKAKVAAIEAEEKKTADAKKAAVAKNLEAEKKINEAKLAGHGGASL